MAETGGSEVDEGDVKIYFGSGKGAATGIWQAWRGWGTRGGSTIHIILVFCHAYLCTNDFPYFFWFSPYKYLY